MPRAWTRPDDAFLALIGMSRTQYWETIYDHAKSDDVRINTGAELRKPKTEDPGVYQREAPEPSNRFPRNRQVLV